MRKHGLPKVLWIFYISRKLCMSDGRDRKLEKWNKCSLKKCIPITFFYELGLSQTKLRYIPLQQIKLIKEITKHFRMNESKLPREQYVGRKNVGRKKNPKKSTSFFLLGKCSEIRSSIFRVNNWIKTSSNFFFG